MADDILPKGQLARWYEQIRQKARAERQRIYDQQERVRDMADEATTRLLGPLPVWVPLSVKFRVRQIVIGLLYDEISLDSVQRLIEYPDDDGIPIPGAVRDPRAFLMDVNYLAHVRWALSLPEERALIALDFGGTTYLTGHKRRQDMARFAKEHAEGVKEERERYWDSVRAKAREIQASRTRPASKRQLAELVKTALNLPDKVEAIRKKI